uniref:Synaptotagmin 8 n=1 Tax=Amphilophus citrinellus TaxID=61819 RepID=A0A3Q0S897_AMPCI
IFAVGGLLILLCCLCICIKCCCRGKKKKKKEQINLKDVNGKTTTALVSDGALSCATSQYLCVYCWSLQLRLGIKQASNLMAMDLGGTSDPYVRVYILPEKSKTYETKVFKSTLNPVFNEQFTFEVGPGLLGAFVFDFNRFSKHEIIGEIRVELCKVDWNHIIEEWQELDAPAKFEEENLGEICFSLRYVPSASKLTVIILEAKSLKNPYVKVQLALDKRKWKKRKTSIKKKTLNPYFNESFVFDVSLDQIQRVNLVISVWDHDAVTRNDPIGKIYLGCDATGNQLRHWADMLSNPRRPVAQWHSLLSAEQVNSTLSLKKKIPIPSKLRESTQQWHSK